MKRILFLGPGTFKGSGQPDALVERRRLALVMRPSIQAIIMEDEATLPGEALAEKFLRLLRGCEGLVAWLPRKGTLPTVFSELVALRFRDDLHDRPLYVFYEKGVLDATREEFVVKVPVGKIAYLRDIRTVMAGMNFRYDSTQELEALLSSFSRGELARRPRPSRDASGHARALHGT